MSLKWQKYKRLLVRKDYQACYQLGEKHFTKLFVIFVKKSPCLVATKEQVLFNKKVCTQNRCAEKKHAENVRAVKSPRVGMAVSKKSGNAVARNRIKRVLREVFRIHQAVLPFYDFVIVPKRHVQAKRINFASVEKDVIPFLTRLGE